LIEPPSAPSLFLLFRLYLSSAPPFRKVVPSLLVRGRAMQPNPASFREDFGQRAADRCSLSSPLVLREHR
jgi:hypothetical protein